MKIIVISFIIAILSLPVNLNSIDQKKKVVYLYYNNDSSKCKFTPSKRKINNEIQFNLCSGSILFSNSKKNDTMNIFQFKKYKIYTEMEIEQYKSKWNKDEYEEFKLKTKRNPKVIPKPIHLANKDYIFETYLIEKISPTKIVIYSVEWRDIEIQK